MFLTSQGQVPIHFHPTIKLSPRSISIGGNFFIADKQRDGQKNHFVISVNKLIKIHLNESYRKQIRSGSLLFLPELLYRLLGNRRLADIKTEKHRVW